jgi:hypothetical protein
MGHGALTIHRLLLRTRTRCLHWPGVHHIAHAKTMRLHTRQAGRCTQWDAGLRGPVTEHSAKCKRRQELGHIPDIDYRSQRDELGLHSLEGPFRGKPERMSYRTHTRHRGCLYSYVSAEVQLDHELARTDRAAGHREADKTLAGRREAGLRTTSFALGQSRRDMLSF